LINKKREFLEGGTIQGTKIKFVDFFREKQDAKKEVQNQKKDIGE
jgi:hypothetical protein